MKAILLPLIMLLLGNFILIAQNIKQEKGVYAVVVAINDYENAEQIPKLNYADKDAHAFVNFLKSKAGGNIPVQNISLLLNKDANIAAIQTTLTNVLNKANKGDLVYFYFSGHGDSETRTEAAEDGFLLAYNSPATNYVGNAISVAWLNKYAENLTIQKGANIILITDACHSGNLAGDFYKGKEYTAENLQKVLNHQVRMASCLPDELSVEDEIWGGGRGVFSWYLINGLNGLAAPSGKQIITVEDLSSYIDSAFKNEQKLLHDKHKQQPKIEGSPIFQLSTVDTSTAINNNAIAQNQDEDLPVGLPDFRAEARSPMDCFFSMMEESLLDTLIDFKKYTQFPTTAVSLKMLSDYLAKYNETFPNADSLTSLYNQLQNYPQFVSTFNDRFVITIHNQAQQMVNAYISGDIADLEKRQYYYSGTRSYADILPKIELAMHLIDSSNDLRNKLEVQLYYITGLVYRMQMTTTKNTDPLLKNAFKFQFKALSKEPYAGYVHNELGNQYMHKQDFDSASIYYKRAMKVAPAWAIPWSNMIRVGLAKKDYNAAEMAALIADSLQPNLAFVNMNIGLFKEQEGDMLAAQERYLRAIEDNEVHYLPFQKLGMIYLSEGDYKKADKYLYGAALRKDAFEINEDVFNYGIELGGQYITEEFQQSWDYCELETMDSIPAWQGYIDFIKALYYLEIPSNKESLHKKSLQLNSAAQFIATHLLGRNEFKNERYDEALPLLKKAIDSYLPYDTFVAILKEELLDTLINYSINKEYKNQNVQQLSDKRAALRKQYSPLVYTANNCIVNILGHMAYQIKEQDNHYRLALIYQKYNEPKKEIEEYKKAAKAENRQQMEQAVFKGYDEKEILNAIERNTDWDMLIAKYEKPIPMVGSLTAAARSESIGDYKAAETILLEQVAQNRAAGYARQAMRNKGQFGPIARYSAVFNYYWLNVNRDLEAATYNFYNRMLQKFPRDSYWYQQAGLFLYNRLALSYYQINYKNRQAFYESSKESAYPFLGSDATSNYYIDINGNEQPGKIEIEVPISNEKITIPLYDYNPVENALEYLGKAIKYSGDLAPQPNILEARADLQSWQGNYSNASKDYETILQNEPNNITIRNKLNQTLTLKKYMVAAYYQLDTLAQLSALDNQQRFELANYQFKRKEDAEALKTLAAYVPIDRMDSNEVYYFKAKINWRKGNYKLALQYLNDSMLENDIAHEDDSDTLALKLEQNALRLYSMARIFALEKNKSKAYQFLADALQAGFRYSYVLQQDDAWLGLRNSKFWNANIKELIKELDYKENPEYTMDIFTIMYRIPGSNFHEHELLNRLR